MRLILVLLMSTAAATQPLVAQASLEGRVDSVFRQYASTETPGCAVGVAQRGRVLLERAYGMADLERSVALTPASILEAGSVSKQFTAAAVLLLAQDGKLSLDDPVRRWVPEVPDFGGGKPLTLRHLLNHTSGLRDWGSIAGIGGWPRNTRALDHRHVLQIISRMRELNFPPGTEYEYSNSNYNLLAIVAERASGESLPAFTRRRIFEPLGMTSTSWRDDAMRVVRGRALSYDKDGAEWKSDRAIENIYGNCCLLTTVGDLLKWNAAFDSTRLGGAGLRAEQERRGVLANGRTITYAAGLFVDTYRGQPYVAHSGATAGYRAYAVRYPTAGVSVAVLCNAGNADPESMGDSLAGALVAFTVPAAAAAPARVAPAPPVSAIADKAGLYRNLRDMRAQRLRVTAGRLETENGVELVPANGAGTAFQAARGGMRIVFNRRDGASHYDVRIVSQSGDTVPADWVAEADTGRAALTAYAGEYESPEADATVRVALDTTGTLAVTGVSTPDGPWRLRPLYRDGFAMPAGVLVFTRDASGRVAGFRFTTGRVRNLKFERR
jgi:CubicO group peptidase (beta-lactamase class C family)